MSEAKSVFAGLVEKDDRLSEFGVMLCDAQVSHKNINIRNTYQYTADVQTSYAGYVSGGGSRTRVY